jgi:hypothetical protein
MRQQRWRRYGVGAGGMLVLVTAFLLATGWGSAAAAQITSVFVTNDSANPVPVQEQRADANGNIKIHEQGTASVRVDNTVPVIQRNVEKAAVESVLASPGETKVVPVGPIRASLITITDMGGRGNAVVQGPGSTSEIGLSFSLSAQSSAGLGPANNVILPLSAPMSVDAVIVQCFSESPQVCFARFNVAG